MASVLLLAGFSALLAVAGAALYTVIRERAELRERVHARFEQSAGPDALRAPGERGAQGPALRWLDERLRGAGLEARRWQLVAGVFVAVLATGSGALARGPLGAGFAVAALAGGAAGWLAWRTRRRSARILEQLPGFLDHVVRAVQTGSSLPNAVQAATEETQEPIRSVFARVGRQTRLGVSLDEALEQAARLYAVRELGLLSLTVRVSQRYGGSVRDVLGSIVAMVRQRERLRREFRALTGETRLSAVILGALPATIAVYVMLVNPDYLARMTADDAGRIALWIAGGLQVIGSLVLWRMVRSV